jgi:hypothetical protein
MWLTPRAFASSYTVTTVGLRRPFSRPLTYCWLNPEMSQNSSCVRLFSSRIRLTFCPTSLRISMHRKKSITQFKFTNYSMYSVFCGLGGRPRRPICGTRAAHSR